MENFTAEHPMLIHLVRFSRLLGQISPRMQKYTPCWQMSVGDLSLMLIFEQLRCGGETPLIRMSEISRRLAITPPAATQMITRLEKKGLVERVQSSDDKRSVFVQMTPQAVLESQLHMEGLVNLAKDVADDLGPEDCEELSRLLGRLYESLMTRTQGEE